MTAELRDFRKGRAVFNLFQNRYDLLFTMFAFAH